ncbi:hypothetical protein Tco_0204553 [Tanacetum coccineum]
MGRYRNYLQYFPNKYIMIKNTEHHEAYNADGSLLWPFDLLEGSNFSNTYGHLKVSRIKLHDRDDRYRDDPIRSLGLKIEIPEFTGKVYPDDFIDWLIEEEKQIVARFLGVLKPEIADIANTFKEEEEAESMAGTMEQYMSKTRTDYGSGVDRPKIEEKDSFELKGQFFKELRENTFSGSDNEDANEHIEKVLKIVDLFHDSPKYAVVTDRTYQNSKLLYKSRQMTVPFPSHLDNHYCEEEEGNYGPKFTEAYGASHINNIIPRKEKDPRSFTLPCFINNVCFDNAIVDLGASVSVMPILTYLNLGLGELAHAKLTMELADRTVKYPKGIAENVLVGIGKFTFPVDFIILDMPEDIKVPLILERPFLSTARAKIDVYKRKITLRVREEKIIFKSVKPASSLIKRVYMLSLRERMELDLEARLMGETLVLNRSLDPFLEDYIELNDLNEPFELRRNQGDDLIPTIQEGEVIEEFKTRDEDLDTGIDDYPSYCDSDKKIHIDCAHNLKGDNVAGALMSVPIFVGTFSVVTDFVVLENMEDYRYKGMGDVIFGEPFLREVGIKARRFEGMITLYKDNDDVTYQIVRSHSRFKCHTNEQCNKIPPLLKVSEKDEKNGISHA